ncbi:MAG: right-handed parallel beta-helix repeat-containing protein [Planctomycetes bacterium]|nr:right-handed parallel beta-helix repeat-containing protein [Planctomycetota bacterium]
MRDRGQHQGVAEAERLERRTLMAADASLPMLDVGNPSVVDLWVDPDRGSDAATGSVRSQALRTVTEAWRRVPAATPLTTGVRINLVAGTYPESSVPNYWESRRGTVTAPVIVRAADGPGTARLPAINAFNCRRLYLDGLDISAAGGDVAHFEACTHVLLRDCTIRGVGTIATYDVPQEALKANQCRFMYVERCDISGAWDNAVDFVAVQGGHVVASRIHRAGDWALYVKGGSTNMLVAGNEFFEAGTGGFTAGQGTGFEFMVAPWLTYEATGITFRNNLVRDVEGAGFGVNGGSDIVISKNAVYRAGTRSHVIEAAFGSRSCDGDVAACRTRLAQGGWGTDVVGAEEPIPNRNVSITDNVVLNPDGVASRWQQFFVPLPRTPSPGSNIPSPARADDGLVMARNVIWNGPADHPLGIEQDGLAAAVRAGNAINVRKPALVDPARGDYRVVAATGIPVNAGPQGDIGPARPPAPLTAAFGGVPVTTATALTSVTLSFARPVTGVTLDDFVLKRGTALLSPAGMTLTTTDNRTFALARIPGTNVAGAYTLRLKGVGTGIADAAGLAPAPPILATWRMTQAVP